MIVPFVYMFVCVQFSFVLKFWINRFKSVIVLWILLDSLPKNKIASVCLCVRDVRAAFRSLWFQSKFQIKSNKHTHKLHNSFDSLIYEHRLSALFNVLLHRLQSINAIEMKRWICSGRLGWQSALLFECVFLISLVLLLFAVTITNSRHRINCNRCCCNCGYGYGCFWCCC